MDRPSGVRLEMAAAVVWAVLFVLAWPRTFAVIDESTYLSTAFVYRAGTIYSDVAGVDPISRVESPGGHEVSKFAPLWPLLLAPLAAPEWRATFAANALLHLVGFLVFARILREAKLPAWGSLLYLAHPTLVYYARTLMSDVAAGVLFLLAWAAWRRDTRRGALLAGAWLGASCLVRTTHVVLAALFVLAAALECARRRVPAGRLATLLAGLVPGGVALAVYQHVAFGRWWRGTSGYRDDRADIGMEGQFGLHELVPGAVHYGSALLAVFPLMLLGVLFYRGRDRWFVRTVTLGTTLFFCLYYYRDTAGGWPASAVVGLRFLVPVLPMFLLAYVEMLDRWTRRVPVRLLAGGVGAVALAACAVVHAGHDALLRGVDAEVRLLHAVTPEGAVILCDTEARKRIHAVWGERTPVRVEFRNRWSFPERLDPDRAAFLAVAGSSLRCRPEPLVRFLEASGARLLPDADGSAGVAVWSLPAAPARQPPPPSGRTQRRKPSRQRGTGASTRPPARAASDRPKRSRGVTRTVAKDPWRIRPAIPSPTSEATPGARYSTGSITWTSPPGAYQGSASSRSSEKNGAGNVAANSMRSRRSRAASSESRSTRDHRPGAASCATETASSTAAPTMPARPAEPRATATAKSMERTTNASQ
ncbi:MAG: hypothetical protein ACT4PE_07675 [Candidatus Eiseniibacteriota bacterium]